MLIDWKAIQEHCPDITGIIHVGAYIGEEAKYYKDIPTKWIEADPSLIAGLKARGLVQVFQFAATDYEGTAELNIMPFRPANSLLKPNLNKRRSDVYVEDTIKVPAERIETIQEPLYNYIALDIQGAELNALRGCDLSQFQYIMTEVHKVETYWGCTRIEELDELLSDFKRVITKWTKHGWGDALYIRK